MLKESGIPAQFGSGPGVCQTHHLLFSRFRIYCVTPFRRTWFFLDINVSLLYYIGSLSKFFGYAYYTMNFERCQVPMSPRPYRLGQRQAASEQTRTRIIRAARELLLSVEGFAGFSIDAVARQADVARMTVYHQFGSKIGLLEALCDSLAIYGWMEQCVASFRQPCPLDALTEYITIFSRFWEADRLVTRRLRGLAALDSDFEQVIRARDERRRHGLRVIVGRIAQQYGRPAPEAIDETIHILYTLISFECFDLLARPTRSIQEVTPIVHRLAH